MDAIYNEYERLGSPYEDSYATVYKVGHAKYGYVRALKVLKDSIISEDDKKYQTFFKEYQMLLKIGIRTSDWQQNWSMQRLKTEWANAIMKAGVCQRNTS